MTEILTREQETILEYFSSPTHRYGDQGLRLAGEACGVALTELRALRAEVEKLKIESAEMVCEIADEERQRTHCPQGHPLDGLRGNGKRYCLTCNRNRAGYW